MVLSTAAQKIKSMSVPVKYDNTKNRSEIVVDTHKMARVANILNPVSNDAVRLAGGAADVGAPVRTVVRAGEAALVIAGAGAVAAGSAAARAGVVAAAKTTAGKFGLPALIALGAAGVAGVMTAFGGKPTSQQAPQTATQTQQPTQTTSSVQKNVQRTTSYDYSQRYQSTTNTIYNSPGASIAANPNQAATFSPGFSPTQATVPYQYDYGAIGQQAQQSATSGMDWGMIALIGIGIFALSKK